MAVVRVNLSIRLDLYNTAKRDNNGAEIACLYRTRKTNIVARVFESHTGRLSHRMVVLFKDS